MNSLSHAGLSGYLLRAKLQPGPRGPEGAFTLVFDSTLRVSIHSLTRGDIGLRSRVARLPAADYLSAELMRRALDLAGTRPLSDASAIVLSDRDDSLELQQRVTADVSADDFEHLLAAYLNSLVAWRAHLGSL